MKVYLDDIRDTPDGWVRVYTVPELQKLVQDSNITVISLDHDLGDGQPTGYDFLVWLEREVGEGRIPNPPRLEIHSANPVGRQNMARAIESIKLLTNRLSVLE